MKQIDVPDIEQAFTEGLRALGEQEENRDWDPTLLHVSDLAVSIPQDDGGKCARQLWLRVNGVAGKEPTPGVELMWDNGKRIEKRVQQALVAGFMLQGGDWTVKATNLDISERLPVGDEGELDIMLVGPNDEKVIVDVKSVRGNAFKYPLPRSSNELQIQTYMMAERADLGALFYVDREGQNHVKVCWVARNDPRVTSARKIARRVVDSQTTPRVLEPNVKVRVNKGPNAVYVDQPWQCSYCKYLDHGCPGALPPDARKATGLVGHINDEGEFTPKSDDEDLMKLVDLAVDGIACLQVQALEADDDE